MTVVLTVLPSAEGTCPLAGTLPATVAIRFVTGAWRWHPYGRACM